MEKTTNLEASTEKYSNYFLDVQFIEGPQTRRIFGINTMTPPTIDMISIGLASEDGSTYYAVSNEFNLKEAWFKYEKVPLEKDFNQEYTPVHSPTVKVFEIRETVLRKLFEELTGNSGLDFNYENTKNAIETFGKSRAIISEEVTKFCRPKSNKAKENGIEVIEPIDFPKFYSLYSSIPWVTFCWLFGESTKIPKGFPLYCIELAQLAESMKRDFRERLVTDRKRKLVYSAKENADYLRDLHYFLTKK